MPDADDPFPKIVAAIEPGDRIGTRVEAFENLLPIGEPALADPGGETPDRFLGPVHEIERDEALRRGLTCAAELDVATSEAIYEQSRLDWIAKNGPEPERGPKPVAETKPEQS